MTNTPDQNTPIIAPSLDAATVAKDTSTIAAAVARFLPLPVRVTLYTVGIVAGAAGPSLGELVGGQVGATVGIVTGALAAVGSAVAISHLSK